MFGDRYADLRAWLADLQAPRPGDGTAVQAEALFRVADVAALLAEVDRLTPPEGAGAWTAERDGRLAAMLAAVPDEDRGGYFVEMLRDLRAAWLAGVARAPTSTGRAASGPSHWPQHDGSRGGDGLLGGTATRTAGRTSTRRGEAPMPRNPTFVTVRASDVRPYHYGLWSRVGDGEPYANAICDIRWSDDGRHLWFGLDSHNFHKAEPDEVLELVDLRGVEAWVRSQERHKDWVLAPPGMEFHSLTGDVIRRRRPKITDATVDELRAELARRETPSTAGGGDPLLGGEGSTAPGQPAASLPPVTVEVTHDLLLLTGLCDHVRADVVAAWTQEEREQAAMWAGALHLYAADNDDVEVPEMPACVAALLREGPDAE